MEERLSLGGVRPGPLGCPERFEPLLPLRARIVLQALRNAPDLLRSGVLVRDPIRRLLCPGCRRLAGNETLRPGVLEQGDGFADHSAPPEVAYPVAHRQGAVTGDLERERDAGWECELGQRLLAEAVNRGDRGPVDVAERLDEPRARLLVRHVGSLP